jgi:hypothetical protein
MWKTSIILPFFPTRGGPIYLIFLIEIHPVLDGRIFPFMAGSSCRRVSRSSACVCEERGRKKGLRRAPRVWLSDAHAEKNERGRAHATWAERGGKHRSISTLFSPPRTPIRNCICMHDSWSAALLSISTCTRGLKFVEGCCFLLENQCFKKYCVYGGENKKYIQMDTNQAKKQLFFFGYTKSLNLYKYLMDLNLKGSVERKINPFIFLTTSN